MREGDTVATDEEGMLAGRVQRRTSDCHAAPLRQAGGAAWRTQAARPASHTASGAQAGAAARGLQRRPRASQTSPTLQAGGGGGGAQRAERGPLPGAQSAGAARRRQAGPGRALAAPRWGSVTPPYRPPTHRASREEAEGMVKVWKGAHAAGDAAARHEAVEGENTLPG